MEISRLANFLPSWDPKQTLLVVQAVGLGCHGLFLVGKVWRGMPSSITRTANAYTYVSALFYIQDDLRRVAHRIGQVAHACRLGNAEVSLYSGVHALNSALNIILSLGYTLAAVSPPERASSIYLRLKPWAQASLLIGVLCTFWTRGFLDRTDRKLKACQGERSEALKAAIDACVSIEAKSAIKANLALAQDNLDIEIKKANTGILQTITYFGHQYLSKNYPDTLQLAIANFALSVYFLKKSIDFHSQENKTNNH